MRKKLEEVIPQEWLGKNRKAELIEILLPLFGVSHSLPSGFIDAKQQRPKDQQMCEVLMANGDKHIAAYQVLLGGIGFWENNDDIEGDVIGWKGYDG